MINYLTFTGVNTGFNEQRTTVAQAHGKIVDLPNHGDISVAFGADYRHEQGGFTPPDLPALEQLGEPEGEVNVLAWPGYVEDGSNEHQQEPPEDPGSGQSTMTLPKA